MSVSTTSTVGSRSRCLARSRRRDGTVTLMPPARQRRHQMPADEAGAAQHQNVVQLHGVFAAASGSSSSSGSPAARAGTVPRRALIGVADLVEHRGVEHGVRHHLLHVVARLGEGNRLGVDRAFERLRVAPAARARRAGIVGGGGEHRVAELVEHHFHVAGAEVDVGLDLDDVLRPEIAHARPSLRHELRGAAASPASGRRRRRPSARR